MSELLISNKMMHIQTVQSKLQSFWLTKKLLHKFLYTQGMLAMNTVREDINKKVKLLKYKSRSKWEFLGVMPCITLFY